jgi:hypothetical protein
MAAADGDRSRIFTGGGDGRLERVTALRIIYEIPLAKKVQRHFGTSQKYISAKQYIIAA